MSLVGRILCNDYEAYSPRTGLRGLTAQRQYNRALHRRERTSSQTPYFHYEKYTALSACSATIERSKAVVIRCHKTSKWEEIDETKSDPIQ